MNKVLVAIGLTIILLAIIIGCVTPSPSRPRPTYSVAGSATRHGNEVSVMYNGGSDADQVTQIQYTGEGECLDSRDSSSWADGKPAPSPGEYCIISDVSERIHVSLIALFRDNINQVILDGYY